MLAFNHFNFNALDMEKSIDIYRRALGLFPVSDRTAADGSFRIVFLSDGVTGFRLELTWLRDHEQPYDLGECEYHLALTTDDYDGMKKKHGEMGCVCFVNENMGIYFLEDPDGYWIEIVPEKK